IRNICLTTESPRRGQGLAHLPYLGGIGVFRRPAIVDGGHRVSLRCQHHTPGFYTTFVSGHKSPAVYPENQGHSRRFSRRVPSLRRFLGQIEIVGVLPVPGWVSQILSDSYLSPGLL